MCKRGAVKSGWWISIIMMFGVLCSQAEIIWIAPNGSDNGSGTNVSPFASLRRAQKNIKPGDTVCIRGGIYKMRMDDVMEKRGGVTSVIVFNILSRIRICEIRRTGN
jgi:hypothetical protein